MDPALRPMSNSQLLDRTFQIYLRQFTLFAGIALPAAILNLIATLGSKLTALGTAGPKGVAELQGLLILCPVEILSQALAAGATVYAVSAIHLGRTVSISESWSRLKGSLSAVLWAEM